VVDDEARLPGIFRFPATIGISTSSLNDGIFVRSARLMPPAVAAALMLSGFLLASCGGKEKGPLDPSEEQKPPASAPAASTWSLTGLPVKKGEESAQAQPVVVAKVDNSGSEPQAGLSQADLVVEELVEGGITRLAAFYHSRLPKEVGPIRSMRFSDIGIVKPVDALIATSGAAPVTVQRIKEADIQFFGEGAQGFSRDSGRSAPYNLMADLTKVAASTKQESAPPDDYLPWAASGTDIGGQLTKKFKVEFSAGHSSEWEFVGDHYQLLNPHAPANDSFRPDTVLVLKVQTSIAGYKDPAGNPVPETRFSGKGQAMIFHEGKMLRASWKKDGLGGALTLATATGQVKIPAGHVWIELLPAQGGAVTFR
jgi:hypothetical protein